MNGRNMNGKNLNVRYHRNSYARKKMRAIIIICAVALLTLALLLVVIGNILKNKTDNDTQQPNREPSSSDGQSEDVHTSVPEVNAYDIPLSGLNSSLLSEKINAIKSAGGNAASLSLRGESGSELYSSDTAKKLGYQTASASLANLGDVTSRLSSENIYASGFLELKAFESPDDTVRSVMLAYDAAICAEAYRTGLRDVIVRCPDISGEKVGDLLRLAESIRSIEPNCIIGISLTRDFLDSENSAEYVASLWDNYDFLAFDLTDCDIENPYSYVEDSVGGVLYYLLRYNMRLLLPSSDNEEITESILSALNDKGISNRQFVG
ncbi:MAG: hypothetical protein ACI3XQ_08125 [Eubacteriales bacterium]